MKSTTVVGVFTPSDAREIHKRVLGTEYRKAQIFEYNDRDKQGWKYVIFKEELLPVCDSLTEYTQADAAVLMYTEGTDSLDVEEVLSEEHWITVTNRSPYLSCMVGDVVVVRWVIKEWVVVGSVNSRLQAVMQADLAAAIDTQIDPSTAPAKILVMNATGDLKLTSTEVTVVNRFMNISIEAGTYVKIENMYGEWQPYAADCPGDSSFSSSSIGSSC